MTAENFFEIIKPKYLDFCRITHFQSTLNYLRLALYKVKENNFSVLTFLATEL